MEKSKDVKVIFQVAFKSDVGKVRDGNEDNLILNTDLSNQNATAWTWINKESNITLSSRGALLVVADGMGGLNAGEVASRIAVESIRDYFNDFNFEEHALTEEHIQRVLFEAIHLANERIKRYAIENPESRGMGTTVVILWLLGNKANVAWVGDSRVYLSRPQHPLRQLTKDHSLVQELVDAGLLTDEQAFYHPDKNIITQSLGDSEHTPEPSFIQEIVYSGDRILLCSDGLNTMVNDSRIVEILRETNGVKTCAEQLVMEANRNGGHDNITVIVCDILQAPGQAPLPQQRPLKQKVAEQQPAGNPSMTNVKMNGIKLIGLGVLLGILLALTGMLIFQECNEKRSSDNVTPNISKADSLSDSEINRTEKAVPRNQGIENQETQSLTDRKQNPANGTQGAQSENGNGRATQTTPIIDTSILKDTLKKVEMPNSGLYPIQQDQEKRLTPKSQEKISSQPMIPSILNGGYDPPLKEGKQGEWHLKLETGNDLEGIKNKAKKVRAEAEKIGLKDVKPYVLNCPELSSPPNSYLLILKSFPSKSEAKKFANSDEVKKLLQALNFKAEILEY